MQCDRFFKIIDASELHYQFNFSCVCRHPVAEVKGLRTWNHPVESDRSIPKPTVDTCKAPIQSLLKGQVTKMISKLEEESMVLPEVTESQWRAKTPVTQGLREYMIANEHLRAISPKREKWTSGSFSKNLR